MLLERKTLPKFNRVTPCIGLIHLLETHVLLKILYSILLMINALKKKRENEYNWVPPEEI